MRKLRLLATLLPLVALALPAAAGLEKFKDWDKSPEFTYYATDDEQKAWKDVQSDEAAQKFYNLFWGRRHPDYQKTAQNAFRQRLDAYVAKADEIFALGKKRGALTERGKVFIVLGKPTKIVSRAVSSAERPTPGGEEGGFPAGGGSQVEMQFQYDESALPAWAGLKKLVLTFTVDQAAGTESVDKPADVRKLMKKAVSAALVNPKMTEPPVYKTREEYEAEQKAAAAAAAEAAKGPVLSAPARTALEALLGKEPQGPLGTLSLAYGDKATRLMVQLPVPGSVVPPGALAAAAAAPAAPAATAAPAAAPAAPAAAPAAPAEPMKIAVLVRSRDGKDAARREEAAVLQKSRADYFVDMSFPVEPGEYDVAAILFDAAGAEKVSSHRAVVVPALPAELGLSQLLLACNDLPAEGAKGDAPFVFSVRKFVVRGENKLEKTDGLAYAARLYNPAIDPATKKLHLKRSITIKPKSGSTIDVPQPPDEPMLVPEQQGATSALVIDLAGAIVDTNLGDYFRPGDYTLTVKITDVIAGKTVEAKAPFSLVAPPAPAKPAAAAAPAAAAPAPKAAAPRAPKAPKK